MKYFENHHLRFNEEVRAHVAKTFDRLSWMTAPLGTVLGYASDSWQFTLLALVSFGVMQAVVVMVLSVEEKAKAKCRLDEAKTSLEGRRNNGKSPGTDTS